MKTFRPLYDKILVKPQATEPVTKGGIYLPEVSIEKTQFGTVIAVGEGRIATDGKIYPVSIAVGDTIMYGKYGGFELMLDNEDFIVISYRDVYGIVEEES